MSNSMVPFGDMQSMANAICKSGMFGIKTPEQAISLMLIAQAEGLHPAIAARDYHVIQGRPALKADAMLARFQAAGGKVEWTSYTDDKVAAIFSHPSGGRIEVEWTIARAKAAELTGKATWKQYPRQMLRARVISEGIRTVFPGVVVGVYTPEEVQDMEAAAPVVKDMGQAEVVQPEQPAANSVDQLGDLISAQQVAELEDLSRSAKIAPERICKAFGVGMLKHLPAAKYAECKQRLEQAAQMAAQKSQAA